jgi:hypothetical protein
MAPTDFDKKKLKDIGPTSNGIKDDELTVFINLVNAAETANKDKPEFDLIEWVETHLESEGFGRIVSDGNVFKIDHAGGDVWKNVQGQAARVLFKSELLKQIRGDDKPSSNRLGKRKTETYKVQSLP